jgi:phosphatidylinositol alpha-1,6-mannosyltransferase
MGRVPDDDLRDLYNLCEFFIMPSREIESNGHIEGFGIVFLEANAFGKPVIGGQSGGVAEAVQDGVSGLLADPNSPEDIALKMETLLANPAYAKQLGQSGLERLRTRFHWDGYVRRAYALLLGEELP